MTTKKQKRIAGIAKREAFMAEIKENGLKALAADKERQKERAEAMKAAAQEINARHREILDKATS